MNRREFLRSGTIFGTLLAVGGASLVSACNAQTVAVGKIDDLPFKKIVKTNAEWKKILTPEQYRITRQAGTEEPYTSKLTDLKAKGTFICVCCESAAFRLANQV